MEIIIQGIKGSKNVHCTTKEKVNLKCFEFLEMFRRSFILRLYSPVLKNSLFQIQNSIEKKHWKLQLRKIQKSISFENRKLKKMFLTFEKLF